MDGDKLLELVKPAVEEFLSLGTRDSGRYFYPGEVEGHVPEGKAVEVIFRFVSQARLENRPE